MTNCFSVTGGTIASLYAIVLIFWFLASKFTEVVRLDKKNGPGKNTLEQYGFFTYLYVVSITYFIYLLVYVINQKKAFTLNQKVIVLTRVFKSD